MIKNKKLGFTLSETLITLTIVGVVAVLVLPGLIKDSTDKARIALLQSTISSIDTAIQQEITRTGARDLKSTKLKNPSEFLNKLDTAEVKNNTDAYKHSKKIKTINGEEKDDTYASSEAVGSAKLKNGASVYMLRDASIYRLFIDVNGNKEPNIIGIDIFSDIDIFPFSSTGGTGTNFIQYHIGDIGNCHSFSDTALTKDTCKNGNGGVCYCLLEQSGFDPHYLDE